MKVSSFALPLPAAEQGSLIGECGTSLTPIDPHGFMIDSSGEEHAAMCLEGSIPAQRLVQIVGICEGRGVFVEPIVDTSEIVDLT
ncbi:MAG: NfeD family protein [Bacteroidota bacterium]